MKNKISIDEWITRVNTVVGVIGILVGIVTIVNCFKVINAVYYKNGNSILGDNNGNVNTVILEYGAELRLPQNLTDEEIVELRDEIISKMDSRLDSQDKRLNQIEEQLDEALTVEYDGNTAIIKRMGDD